MGNLKESYDKSKDKSGWRVLSGMSREYHDTFIAGDNNLWQIKSEEVKPGEFVAVGMKASRSDEDLLKIMKNPKQTKYKLEDAIVFVKDKKKAARKKKKINQPRQAKFRAKAKAKGNIA